jgi:TolB-like protein/NOL1/NOP2/fmu family ribosome biogenesis protein
MSDVKAPLEEIRQSIVMRLEAQGFVIDEEAVRQTLDRHRVRYLGGLDLTVSRALQEEAGVDAVLITSLELYSELFPPRIALLSRLVSTGPGPEILWSDSVGLAGDDAPGLLGLGLINDPKVLREKAVGVLTGSLDAFFSGRKIDAKGGRGYAPKIMFRSSSVGPDLLENDVNFVDSTSSGEARKGHAYISVALTSPGKAPVTVEYAAGGGTTAAKKNYELKGNTLTFAPGETRKEIEIEVKSNDVYQENKTVDVILKSVRGAALGSTTTHTYTIKNTVPPPTASFASASQAVKETGGAATVLVELSAVSGKDVTVPFTVSGTAKTPGNYTITPGPVVIKAGAKSAAIVVSPVDDKINEEDRTVVVAMGIPVNATQGKMTVSTVTIADADPEPAVGFTAASSSGEEKTSPVRLEVSLGAASGRPVAVEYAVTGGTAVRGKDYAVEEGSLTFAPGETKKEIELGIRDSGLYGDNKTVAVGLKSAKNAVLGGTKTHTYTIRNSYPKPSVAFTAANQRLARTAGNVHLTVQLSNISGKDSIVPFTTGGSAVQGKEYTVPASPVVIPAGERDAVITIEPKGGPPSDADKTIELKLGNPGNALLGSPNYYRLVLVKDARPTIAVLPFFNTSSKNDAGEILMLQFAKELRKLTDFTVIEPGMVREQLLNMRVIMYEGISSSDIDLITGSVNADLIVTGKVFDYKDYEASWGKPRVNFTVMLISKASKKVVWSSSSVNSGDDGLILFNWGEVNTANAMVSKMIEAVRKNMLTW